MGAGAEVEKFLKPPGLPHPRHILLPYVQRGAPRPVHRALGVGWAVVLKAKGSESSLLPPHQSADSCALHSLSHLPFAQPHPSTPAPLGFLPPPTADHLLSLSLLCSPPSALGMWCGGQISSHRCAARRNCCSRRLPRAPAEARLRAFPERPLWRPRQRCEQLRCPVFPPSCLPVPVSPSLSIFLLLALCFRVCVSKSLPAFSPWKLILNLTSSKWLQTGGESHRPGICVRWFLPLGQAGWPLQPGKVQPPMTCLPCPAGPEPCRAEEGAGHAPRPTIRGPYDSGRSPKMRTGHPTRA